MQEFEMRIYQIKEMQSKNYIIILWKVMQVNT